MASILKQAGKIFLSLFLIGSFGCRALASSGAIPKEVPRNIPVARLPAIKVGGVHYLSLRDIGALYGMELQLSKSSDRVVLRNKWHSIILERKSRKVQLDGTLIWMHRPLQKVHGRWALDSNDFYKGIDPVLRPKLYLDGAGYNTVVLDPGHGGKDKGAIGRRNVQEKLVVMDLARRAKKHLERAGLRVVLTRRKGSFVPLGERCKIAARAGGDLFVSIHINAAADSSVDGAETYILPVEGESSTAGYGRDSPTERAYLGNRFNLANSILGYSLQSELSKSRSPSDRGLKRARFKVLKEAPCPAALVECLFLSNHRAEDRLLEASFRESLARGISKGILRYLASARAAR